MHHLDQQTPAERAKEWHTSWRAVGLLLAVLGLFVGALALLGGCALPGVQHPTVQRTMGVPEDADTAYALALQATLSMGGMIVQQHQALGGMAGMLQAYVDGRASLTVVVQESVPSGATLTVEHHVLPTYLTQNHSDGDYSDRFLAAYTQARSVPRPAPPAPILRTLPPLGARVP